MTTKKSHDNSFNWVIYIGMIIRHDFGIADRRQVILNAHQGNTQLM